MVQRKDEERDSLTGALRGELFLDALRKEIASSEKKDQSVSLAMIDLDFFGQINEKHGREVGDEVLKRISSEVTTAFPEFSIYRYGGEEFTILLPGIEKEQAFLRLEQLRATFSKKHEIAAGKEKVSLKLSFSSAVASYPDDAVRAEEIMRKASDALHRAKTTGRNKVCIAREERMVTKTSHYTPGQLQRLAQLAKKKNTGEAALLREALDDLLMKYPVIH